MILVHADELGAVDYARALRDGLLLPLTPGTAAPADIPRTPALRALALSPLVPDRGTVTGLAGLWLEGLTPFPAAIDVLRREGTHRAPRRLQARARICIHAGDPGPGSTRTSADVTFAAPGRCAVDALRWAPLGPSIAAIWTGMRGGTLTPADVDGALAVTPPDRSRRRAQSAWQAIQQCWQKEDPAPMPLAA